MSMVKFWLDFSPCHGDNSNLKQINFLELLIRSTSDSICVYAT